MNDETITQALQHAIAIIRRGRAMERMMLEAGFTLPDIDADHHQKASNGATPEPIKADSSITPEPEPKAPAWPQANDDGELIDARGIVWDERIHSSSRNCNEDGTWRRKRGVDPKLVERIENEAREAATKAQTTEPSTDGESPAPEVTLHSVMTAIDAAETAEDLARIVDLVHALPADEKGQARTYYIERRGAISGATDPHPTEDESANDPEPAPMTFETIRDGLYRAATEDEVAAWWEESQHVVISASQRMALEQVRDGRIKSLNAAQAA